MHVAFQRVQEREDLRDRVDPEYLLLYRRQQRLLTFRSTEVHGILRRIARADKRERPCPVHVLTAGVEVNRRVAGIDGCIVVGRTESVLASLQRNRR